MCTLRSSACPISTSPNAEEALSLLSLPLFPTKELVEQAANKFLDIGVGEAGTGCVIIRSGAMGAYVATRAKGGRWIDAFWADLPGKVVDVTGTCSRVISARHIQTACRGR